MLQVIFTLGSLFLEPTHILSLFFLSLDQIGPPVLNHHIFKIMHHDQEARSQIFSRLAFLYKHDVSRAAASSVSYSLRPFSSLPSSWHRQLWICPLDLPMQVSSALSINCDTMARETSKIARAASFPSLTC
jgi:hypothetical protein